MRALFVLLALVAAAPAAAQAISGDDAQKMLFRGADVQLVANPEAALTADEMKLLELLVTTNDFQYYGAIAFSPDEGLMSETIQGAFDFHDVRTASTEALKKCEEVRAEGTRPCIVAVQVFPKRFRSHPLTLSRSATDAVTDFRKLDGSRAFAISPSSGAFGFASGDDAEEGALFACNGKVDADDCTVVIRD